MSRVIQTREWQEVISARKSERPITKRVRKPSDGVTTNGIAGGVERPEPLAELTAKQAHEWRVIVNRMPPNWFTAETWPILANLCRHIVNSNDISKAMQELSDDLLDDDVRAQYNQLANMLQRESRTIATLSGRLRLTPQSRFESYHAAAEVKHHASIGRRPWS